MANQIKDEITNNGKRMINTIDLTSEEGKRRTINAMNNSVPLKDYMDTVLHIQDCITMEGTRKGRNNMPDSPCVNTILIDTNGVAYFSQSDGVYNAALSFYLLWNDFGKNSTELGCLDIKCISQELPNGNTLKTLVFAE